MKKSFYAAAMCSALALSFGIATSQAQDAGSFTEADARSSNLWFVELTGAPTADGGSLTTSSRDKAAFRRAAAAAGIVYTERRSYSVLFNGFSIEASARDRSRIAGLSGVKAVYPVEIIQAPDPRNGEGAAPDLATAITMTGANIAQNSLGLDGTGVKVAVMDTGIDIDHPDFGGSGTPGTTPFPTARITHGWDFVGDTFNADPSSTAYNPTPAPDAVPDDCNGHGSHVAGIVGANGTIVGVAPGVTFGAYRVFGCDGSTTSDIMLAAMERAHADGMDVLNMSIGSSFQWPQYPTAQAATRLVNLGVSVVTSIGNAGANGIYSASAPGVGSKVIGTASFDNLVATLPAFTVTPGGELVGFNRASGSPANPTSGSLPMSRTGTPASTLDGCPPWQASFGGVPWVGGTWLAAGSHTGNAVLIRRGTCSFYSKSLNAQQAGAAAVVLYNNAAGELNPTVAGFVPAITIPVVAVNATNGVLIDGKIAAGATTLTWGTSTVSNALSTAGLISSFSSYGMAPDLTLKPDIGAPGGSIFSTIPLERGAFGSNSGTSMASPHVAGAVALLLEAKPGTSSQDIRGILQNSADPKNWFGNPTLGFLDNVHRQGAGMLDVVGAVTSTTRVTPSKISAGESAAGAFSQAVTVSNLGASAVTYNLSSVNALSTGANSFAPSFNASDGSVGFSVPSVTVAAGGTATFNATITGDSTPAGGLYGGYIVLTNAADAADVLRVPFAGYIGDYQARVALANTVGFPFLGRLTACTILRGNDCALGGSYSVFPAGNTYSMADAFNIPSFLIHLDHQVRLLRLEVFEAESGKAWKRIANDEYVGRNSTATSFFAYAWDGTTTSGNSVYTVPNGQYVVKLTVQKALGDAANPAHSETWTSPVITIARP